MALKLIGTYFQDAATNLRTGYKYSCELPWCIYTCAIPGGEWLKDYGNVCPIKDGKPQCPEAVEGSTHRKPPDPNPNGPPITEVKDVAYNIKELARRAYNGCVAAKGALMYLGGKSKFEKAAPGECDARSGSYRAGCECSETISGKNGAGYRGCQTTTRKGKTCQMWSAQAPHHHSHNKPSKNDPHGIENHNYCRNPAGESDTIWCYWHG